MDTTKEQFGKIANVVGYRDNPDGTTTNFLSDGTQDTGKLSPNNDGSYSFNPIGQNVPTTITSDMLKASPTPLKLPEQKIPTTATGLIGSATAANEQIMKNLEAEKARAEKVKTESGFDLQNTINQAIGIQSSRLQEEQNANLPKLREDVTAIANEIDTVQRAYQNELKALDSSNMSDAGRSAASRDISRKYASQLADLSIVQSARNRNLATAQANVDRKIELQLEPLKLKLDYQKTVYEDNKDNFTKADDRRYQALIKSTERELNKEEERVKTLENTKLKYMDIAASLGKDNTVLTAMTKATSPEEILSIASKNGVISVEDQLKFKQLEKINKEIKTMGIPTITNPEASSASQALNVILGSTKLTPEQKKTLISSINTGDNAFSVVKNQAKDIMGQTLATDLSKAETAKQQLERIDTLTKQFYAKGGDTGIFSGNFEKVLNRLGNTTDPELVNLASSIALAMQEYRLAVTGTAASVQEDSRIDNVFAGITKGEILNNARTKALINSFDNKIDASYRNVLGKGYDALKQDEIKAKNTEQIFITKIVSFASQSSENKKRIDELRNMAPNATPEEITKLLNI